MEDHGTPVLTFADVGDAEDPKGGTGMARVFEHMAFMGTTEIGSNNVKAEAKALDTVDDAL